MINKLKKQKKPTTTLKKYIVNEKIEFEKLPENIEVEIRKILLKWVSRANQNKYNQTKAEDGRTVTLHYPKDNKKCKLRCVDGTLLMPAFILEIK